MEGTDYLLLSCSAAEKQSYLCSYFICHVFDYLTKKKKKKEFFLGILPHCIPYTVKWSKIFIYLIVSTFNHERKGNTLLAWTALHVNLNSDSPPCCLSPFFFRIGKSPKRMCIPLLDPSEACYRRLFLAPPCYSNPNTLYWNAASPVSCRYTQLRRIPDKNF